MEPPQNIWSQHPLEFYFLSVTLQTASCALLHPAAAPCCTLLRPAARSTLKMKEMESFV